MKIKMSDRERNMIIAALRLWQIEGGRAAPAEIQDIADEGVSAGGRLKDTEIDVLCERINLSRRILMEQGPEDSELEKAYRKAQEANKR